LNSNRYAQVSIEGDEDDCAEYMHSFRGAKKGNSKNREEEKMGEEEEETLGGRSKKKGETVEIDGEAHF